MNVRYRDSEDSQERDELIKEVLPQQTIISEILEPIIEKRLFKELAECVRRELDIYRNFPKKTNKEPIKEQIKTFDPRNNNSCFMGKAFKANEEIQDAELTQYRRAIGTIPHHVWGNVTLLEIWGGDHFEEHTKMVLGAFEYGMRLRETCPRIKFFVNPLFKNQKSKEFKLSDYQKEQKEYMDELMARAMTFGVRTPAEARKIIAKERRLR